MTSQENQISDLPHCQVMSCLIINWRKILIDFDWLIDFLNFWFKISFVLLQVTVQVGFDYHEHVKPNIPTKFSEKC